MLEKDSFHADQQEDQQADPADHVGQHVVAPCGVPGILRVGGHHLLGLQLYDCWIQRALKCCGKPVVERLELVQGVTKG
jgi:hypothetical protein